MAEYRSIHTRIWEDSWFRSLDADGKVLWIYLFSNHRASVCGVYRVTLEFMAFETGLTPATCRKWLEKFEADDKAYFYDDLLWVTKLRDLQDTGSASLRTRINDDAAKIPDGKIKQLYMARYATLPPPSLDPPPTVPTPIRTVTVTDTVTDTADDAPRLRPLSVAYMQNIKHTSNTEAQQELNAVAVEFEAHPLYQEALWIEAIENYASRKLADYKQANHNRYPGLKYICVAIVGELEKSDVA